MTRRPRGTGPGTTWAVRAPDRRTTSLAPALPAVPGWRHPHADPPGEGVPVTVLVRGKVRPGYYRIANRWYALVDLEQWQMNRSPYWLEDRSWYLQTHQIEGWR